MSKLTTEERKKLKEEDFALPGRRYPYPDKSHGANALARAAQHATPEEKAKIKKKVCSKYSDLPSCKYADPLG